ncbi:MAG: response regulator transcription factor [Chloroflexi bacterium]|nr:response regulator transcription factor [Chloroflexota bacterium]
MQTILIIEDDEMIVSSVRYGLEREGYRVLAAANGEEGLTVARAAIPDLVLLDVMMPVMDGLQCCRTLRAESSVPIIMLTARGEELDKVLGLELGADDYMVKPFSMRELIARIRAQLRRVEMQPRAVGGPDAALRVGALSLDCDRHMVIKGDRPIGLRPKEFDLLAALMAQPGHAFERGDLLDAVWGEGWIGDPRTLDVHIRWLRQKLEDDPAQPRYIVTVRGLGYRFATSEEVQG